ncbi:MAG: polysaccharide pyruvyl transferase family protein [Kiritimatiellia bacterium]
MREKSESSHDLDVLFVHVPKFRTFYPPLNVYQSCNRMAIGLLALADITDREGFSTRVLHVGIERMVDPGFSFADYLKRHKPRVIAFSLHFHHGILDTFRLVREARGAVPEAFIVMGGFTATFFASAIMERLQEADAIIAGDAEGPMRELARSLLGKQTRDLSGIPNLVWRRGSETETNRETYLTDQETLDRLVYTRFDLLEHASLYRNMPKAYLRTRMPRFVDKFLNRKLSSGKAGIFWGLPVGRGCLSNCFYCGGGAKAQRRICGREGVLFRDPEKVIETIKELKKLGFKGSYVSFDPRPFSRDYYMKLFGLLRERNVEFDLIFSSWGPHSPEFFDEFARTFGPGSSFLISPETGSEELRKKARPPGYSNRELFESLEYADKLGIKCTVFFSIGVPGETKETFAETLALKREIERRFSRVDVEAFLIEMEPASPWHLDPERYGIDLERRGLEDFVRDQSAPDYSSMSYLGYSTAFFSDHGMPPRVFSRRLLKLKCRHFCSQRFQCFVMRIFWFVTRTLGLAPRPRGADGVRSGSKRLCVLGSNSGRNAGDSAILSSIVGNISELRPGTRFEVPVPSKKNLYSRFSGKNVRAVGMMPWYLSLRFLGLPTVFSIMRSDVVLITDGIIFDVRLFNPLFNFLIQLVFLVPLARLFRRKVVCLLVGVGPLDTRAGRAFASFVCRRCDDIYVRESHSRKLLEMTGVPCDRIREYADAAFACVSAGPERGRQILKETGLRESEELIGINVNTYIDRWLGKNRGSMGRRQFSSELAAGIDAIIERTGSKVCFVLTQVMDIQVAETVRAKSAHSEDIAVLSNRDYSPEEMMSAVGEMRVFVGMRLHSLILATAVNTPCVGLIYAPKVRHFMELTGMEEFAMELSDLTAGRLADKVHDMLKRESQLREKIERNSARLREKAREGFRDFAEKYL